MVFNLDICRPVKVSMILPGTRINDKDEVLEQHMLFISKGY